MDGILSADGTSTTRQNEMLKAAAKQVGYGSPQYAALKYVDAVELLYHVLCRLVSTSDQQSMVAGTSHFRSCLLPLPLVANEAVLKLSGGCLVVAHEL